MFPKTLVIGCGKKQIKHLSELCTAIDISKDAIDESKKLKPENEYIETDVTSMPFDDNYFDKVIITEVLQYIDYPKKALSEIRRVMNNDAKLILSVPVGRTSDFLGKKFPIYEKYVVRGHHKFLFTKELIEDLLKGFRDVKIQEKDKFSTAYWFIWGLVSKKLIKNIGIDKKGYIISEEHPKLIKFVNDIILFLAFIGQIFVGKSYYKTYYVEAIK